MCPQSCCGRIDHGLLLSLCMTDIMECAHQCAVFTVRDKKKRTSYSEFLFIVSDFSAWFGSVIFFFFFVTGHFLYVNAVLFIAVQTTSCVYP